MARRRYRRRIAGAMKLGLSLGYAPPGTNPADLFPLVHEAERLGFDSVWVAEAWGTDAVSVLGWLAARTERIKLGSAIMQIPGRTPANAAMTAATLDLLSDGRFLLGLGTSGPQVVEGWHGQPWGKPLGKTREYVKIVRAALRDALRPHVALYVGGMGAKGRNFYNALVRRYGWEEEAERIQELYLAGKQREAIAAVPDELVDAVSLVGPKERIAERLEAWRETPVTTLVLGTTQPEALRTLAELVL